MKPDGRILLDTNIISDINNNVSETIAPLKSAKEIFVPSIVAGELFYGIQNSSKKEANLQFYRNFFNSCVILDVNFATAEIYGNTKTRLKEKGRPIPENDIWIAAIAIQHDLTLVTHDKHFDDIEGLALNLL